MARTRSFDKETALEKAMRLFQCRGYEAASMQEITEATGLSRSSLYDTFGDKSTLYRAALDHYIVQRGGWVLNRLAEPGSVREAMRDVFNRVIEEIIGSPTVGCLAVNAITELSAQDTAVQEAVARNTAQNIAAFAEAIRAGQREGEIEKGKDPEALAAFLASAIHGLRVTGKATQERKTLENIVTVALSVLD